MNIKRLTSRSLAVSVTSVMCLVAVSRLSAQTPAPAANATKEDQSDVVVLSPFVVEASDSNGYTATSTLAGTRVRTDLKDLASAISVVTQQFLQDTGAKNSADLLIYTPSTEVGGLHGNFSGAAGGFFATENTLNPTTRVRGLDSADNTRDYFLTDIPWDSFNVGRVDLQRGPNSILFGVGSPAGIINASPNEASFKNGYKFENLFDQYGRNRNSIDLNQVLLSGVAAIRFSALLDNQLYEQKPAYNNSARYYAAIRFDPKLIESGHTSLRVKFEKGSVRSNNPRDLPPGDTINPWFTTGVDAYGNPGLNKYIVNQYNYNSPLPSGLALPNGAKTTPAGSGSLLTNGLALTQQGRSYWADILNYFEGTDTNANNISNPTNPSGTPIKTIVAQVNTGWLNVSNGNPAGANLGGANVNWLPRALPQLHPWSSYVGTVNGFNGYNSKNDGTPAQGLVGNIPGGAYYANKVITDPTIFNFYKNLLDGPNKKELQDWKAFNAVFEQAFLHDRLAVQVAYDHQDYTSEQWAFLNGENYSINVDINATFADGSANPNAGRPYVSNALNNNNTRNRSIRDSFRVTATGELRASDFLGNTKLAQILGRHNFTALYEDYRNRQDGMTFATYATTTDYPTQNGATAANTVNSVREFSFVVYLGPNMSSRTSAAGLNLSNVKYTIAPPATQVVRNFMSTWVAPFEGWNALNPAWRQSDGSYILPSGTVVAHDKVQYLNDGSALALYGVYTNPVAAPAGYVDPMAPYSYRDQATGNVTNVTQLSNPANYTGWSAQTVNWLAATNPNQFSALVQAANRSKFRDISEGFTWQGYLFDGALVPTFGWRKDHTTSFQSTAQPDNVSGGVSPSFWDDPVGSRSYATGESKTWGVVAHLPKSLEEKLPWNSTISAFYNRGDNFKADATRLSLKGDQLPSASGKTTEYGITITTLREKLSLKVSKFNTEVLNATLNGTNQNNIGGLGQNAYYIPNGVAWGYYWATLMQDGLQNKYGMSLSGGLYGDYASADGFDTSTDAGKAAALAYNINGGTAPNGKVYAGAKKVTDAWVALAKVLPYNYFLSYGQSPAINPAIAGASGNLHDGFTGGLDDQHSSNPGGSAFGNHATTVNNRSTGTEIELSYQPLKNWNITANYTHVSAKHTAIDPVTIGFISQMTGFYNGPGGQIREWWNGGGASGTDPGQSWDAYIVAPYAVLTSGLNHMVPEMSPWRLNLISTYTFDTGVVKGLFVGGAYRVDAAQIIGYKYDPTFINVLSGDPNYANVKPLVVGGLNPDLPLKGQNESHLDAWIGYSKKLSHDINWRIQVNVRNVAEKDRLFASQLNPDGSLALARIQQGMSWQLTNTFEF